MVAGTILAAATIMLLVAHFAMGMTWGVSAITTAIVLGLVACACWALLNYGVAEYDRQIDDGDY